MQKKSDHTPRRWLPAVVLASVLAVLVAVALIVQALTKEPEQQPSSGSSAATQGAGEPTPEVSGSSTSADEDFADPCQGELSTDTANVDDEAPSVDEWMSAGYNVIPVSTKHGGCKENESGLRTGYSHTPSGALLAATTYAIAVSPSGINAADRLDEAVMEGPDKEDLIAQAEGISEGQEAGGDPEALRSAELIGYDARNYTEDEASFTLYLEITDSTGNRRTAAGQADLVWEDGDWKVQPASGQQLMTVSEASGDPAVQWGPNNA